MKNPFAGLFGKEKQKPGEETPAGLPAQEKQPEQEELMGENWQLYMTGPPKETWQQALQRLESFCSLTLDSYTDEDTGELVEVSYAQQYNAGEILYITRKEPLERMNLYEHGLQVAVPPQLKELMCGHGAFHMDLPGRFDQSIFEIYDSEYDYSPNIKPFSKAIAYHFSSTHHLLAQLDEYRKKLLDENCFFFGCTNYDHQNKGYLYFDRRGGWGSYYFQDEDFPASSRRLTPLLDGKAEIETLDELLVKQINHFIRKLLDRAEVLDYPWEGWLEA